MESLLDYSVSVCHSKRGREIVIFSMGEVILFIENMCVLDIFPTYREISSMCSSLSESTLR